MHSPGSMTPVKHVFAGVNDTGKACHQCHWHRWRHASPVSLIPDSKYCQLCRCQWHRWCTSRTFGGSPMHLKEQSVKKQAISRYYFSIASIQSSKESSNYNKIQCCGSGMFIPDPDFFPSQIPDPKKHGEVKKFFIYLFSYFFVAFRSCSNRSWLITVAHFIIFEKRPFWEVNFFLLKKNFTSKKAIFQIFGHKKRLSQKSEKTTQNKKML